MIPDGSSAETLGERVAIVTGGGWTQASAVPGLLGIGAAISQVLSSAGYRTLILDRDEAAADRTVVAINAAGGAAMACVADITKESDCARAVKTTIDTWGRLDVLVNSAGITSRDTAQDFLLDEWNRVLAVNVTGAMLMSKHSIPHLSSGSSIVNIASIAAIRPRPIGFSYAVAKGALVSLTKALAVALGPQNVRVNCVCPGSAWTPMAVRSIGEVNAQKLQELREQRRLTLLQTEGTASDIANTVAFLVSEGARWITGQVIVVDGGATMEPVRAVSYTPGPLAAAKVAGG